MRTKKSVIGTIVFLVFAFLLIIPALVAHAAPAVNVEPKILVGHILKGLSEEEAKDKSNYHAAVAFTIGVYEAGLYSNHCPKEEVHPLVAVTGLRLAPKDMYAVTALLTFYRTAYPCKRV